MIHSQKTFENCSTIEPITSGDFKNKVLDSNVPVVVEFTLEWCGPCLKVREYLVKLLENYQGQVSFYTVDIRLNVNLARNYNVDLLPTLIFFKNGTEMGNISGMAFDDSINKMLISLLSI